MTKAIKISIHEYDGSPRKERDRYALIGIANVFLEDKDWRGHINGIVMNGDNLEDVAYIKSKCETLGIKIDISL